MSDVAATGIGRPELRLRGRSYPVLLPSVRDPRLHLAAVIVTLQVLGQTAFGFRLSIAQILVALGTCAVLESGIAFWRRRVLMWPASALLTGNGVAFILRVPGTEHGDWWSLRGAWIFSATAAVGLLSKYVIRWRGRHLFNPSNIGLVLCFLVLGERRAEPLDFWWGPVSPWLAFALALIVAGGLLILARIRLLGVAVTFWAIVAAALAVVSASGHAMSASWHLGPITDWSFWWLLVSSPEVLVFLFFMITDPRTTPPGRVGRIVYAAAVALVAALLIAPQETEFGAKVALLGALALVCALRPLIERWSPAASSASDTLRAWSARLAGGARPEAGRRVLAGGVLCTGVGSLVALLIAAGVPARPELVAAAPRPAERDALLAAQELPEVVVERSDEFASTIDDATAVQIARDVLADLRVQEEALRTGDLELAAQGAGGEWLEDLRRRIRAGGDGAPLVVPTYRADRIEIGLEGRPGQVGPALVATLAGTVERARYEGVPPTLAEREPPTSVEHRFEVEPAGGRYLIVASRGEMLGAAVAGRRALELELRPGGPTEAPQGKPLAVEVVVRNPTSAEVGSEIELRLADPSGRSVSFFREDVVVPRRGEWRRTVPVTPSQWFTAIGGFEISARSDGEPAGSPLGVGLTAPSAPVPVFENVTLAAGLATAVPEAACGQFSNGAAWADVDGDGKLDLFVTRLGEPSQLFVGDGHRFVDQAATRGVAVPGANAAAFADYDNDGDPDLYVARDGPDRLLRNDGSGHFRDVSAPAGITDSYRGMGVAWGDYDADGHLDLYVTNYMRCSGRWADAYDALAQVRYEPDRLYRNNGDGTFSDVTALLGSDASAPGDGATAGAGFGAVWFDFDGDGRLDLYLANDLVGPRPDHNRLWRNDGPGPGGWRFTDVSQESGTALFMNTMGLAVGDVDRDVRLDLALSNIGPNVLLRNEGQGSFGDVAAAWGVARPLQQAGQQSITWGAGLYDFNLDSWEDLYLAAGNIMRQGVASAPQPNELFVGAGDGTSMLDVSALSGADDPGDSKGVAFADYDRDGDVDVFVVNQGGEPHLFRNVTPRGEHHWLEAALTGIRSNRDGCGATLTFTLGDGSRIVRQLVCGPDDKTVHVGLGDAAVVARLEVAWPSGARQLLREVRADQRLALTEPR